MKQTTLHMHRRSKWRCMENILRETFPGNTRETVQVSALPKFVNVEISMMIANM